MLESVEHGAAVIDDPLSASEVEAIGARCSSLLGADLASPLVREAIGAAGARWLAAWGLDGAYAPPASDVQAAFAAAGLETRALAQAYRAFADGTLDLVLRHSDADARLALAKRATAALARELGELGAGDATQTCREHVTMAREEATSAAGSADMVVMNVRMVGAMVNQIHHGMDDVAASTDGARRVADEARAGVEATDARIQHLAELGAQISGIVKVITGIANQTRMLALNAKIEAARAGDHGKGFAVVAEEVKLLAKESQDAAEEISSRIDGISSATAESARSMRETHAHVGEIHELVGKIASAVGEQRELVTGVTTYVDEAAQSVDGIAQGINRAAEQLGAALDGPKAA